MYFVNTLPCFLGVVDRVCCLVRGLGLEPLCHWCVASVSGPILPPSSQTTLLLNCMYYSDLKHLIYLVYCCLRNFVPSSKLVHVIMYL